MRSEIRCQRAAEGRGVCGGGRSHEMAKGGRGCVRSGQWNVGTPDKVGSCGSISEGTEGREGRQGDG